MQQTKQNSSSNSEKNSDSQNQQERQQKSIPSPLREADQIVNKRVGDRDKEYGGFTDSMKKTAEIASLLCDKRITTTDAFKVLMALKLARMAHSPKFDTFVDLIGYAEGLWNYNNDPRFETKTEEEQWDELDIPHPNTVGGFGSIRKSKAPVRPELDTLKTTERLNKMMDKIMLRWLKL